MALRLGLDFGTATTCVATVRNLQTLVPEVVPLLSNTAFVDSLVWVSSESLSKALVPSKSKHDRSPLAVFDQASDAYTIYWKERVKAQKDSVAWARWIEVGREQSMLLSYFKPELADMPEPQSYQVVEKITSAFDPMSQSEDVIFTYASRVIANPAPDSDDLVAGTAAIIREAVSTACNKYGERLDLLLVGMPSMRNVGGELEYKRARNRRMEAVALSGIEGVFGSKQFRADVYGEAEAAGFALDPREGGEEAFVVIIDVGAGTTDMALIPYSRNAGGRWRAGEPIEHDSVRFGGRNINEVISKRLLTDPEVKAAYAAMDERSWQYLLDRDIENIKRQLLPETSKFKVPFYSYAAAPESGLIHNPGQHALRKTVFPHLSLEDAQLKELMRAAFNPWLRTIGEFLERSVKCIGAAELDAIELVGGALRFSPLEEALQFCLWEHDLSEVRSSFRDDQGEAQTAVARGLARRAALME